MSRDRLPRVHGRRRAASVECHGSEAPEQDKDQHDDQDQAARVIAITTRE
jgi:hypothetical protein